MRRRAMEVPNVVVTTSSRTMGRCAASQNPLSTARHHAGILTDSIEVSIEMWYKKVCLTVNLDEA